MTGRSPSRTERAYTALRSDILSGRLSPGERLPFATLCARYEASMGVMREGLSRLVEQGLVRTEPQQGYRVTPLSHDDLVELTDARVRIETMVLREAVARGDLAWESQVIATHHTLSRTPESDPDDPGRIGEEWTVAHAEFHSATLAGCGNARLLAIAESLRDSAELYRQWSRPLGDRGDRDVAGEHRALLDAVLARDADAADRALSDHIWRTTNALLGGGSVCCAGTHGLPQLPAHTPARPLRDASTDEGSDDRTRAG